MNSVKNDLHIASLIAKHLQGSINTEEQKVLDAWIESNVQNKIHFEHAYQTHLVEEKLKQFNTADRDSVWHKTQQKIKDSLVLSEVDSSGSNPPIYTYKWLSIAAAVLLLISFLGLYYYKFDKRNDPPRQQLAQDVAPGKQGATLTLADGQTIVIGEAQIGALAEQSGIRIMKTPQGQIRYESTAKANSSAGFNILKTSRGEQIQIILPDQTLVYLNAESSLKYPSNFNKLKQREVILEGEGYFEVAKNLQQPFIVYAEGQAIKVLGTHFNVNSYGRNLTTTLLEGTVEVSLETGTQQTTTTLKPGEQSNIINGSLQVKNVNANDYIAWTNNVFVFNDIPLTDIMKTLERWYNVDVIYPINFKDQRFFAEIPRNRTLAQVLHDLEKAGNYNFEIKGRRVMVK